MRCGVLPVLLFLAVCAVHTACRADSSHGKTAPGGFLGRVLADRAELFTGGEATDQAVSGYAGIIYSLRGPLTQPGWLVRFYASSGHYSYGATQSYPDLNGLTAEAFRIDYAAETLSAEGMIGYQFAYRNIWLKVYGGVHVEDHRVLPVSASPVRAGIDPTDFALPRTDPENTARGTAFGAKVIAESWMRLGGNSWVSADVSFSTANLGYSAFSRLGVGLPRITESFNGLVIGPELGVHGREDSTVVKSGIFATLPWWGQHLTVSGGLTGNYEEDPGIYGSLGMFRKF